MRIVRPGEEYVSVSARAGRLRAVAAAAAKSAPFLSSHTARRVLKIPKTPDCVSGGRECESERGARRGHESCTGTGLSVHRDTMTASPGATPARVRALTVQVRVPGSNDEPGGWLPGGRRTQGRRAKRSGALGEAGDEDCGSKRREQRAPHAPP